MAFRMTELDKRLLNRIQGDFPLDARPYLRLAEALNSSETEVMARIKELKEGKIIRQISAIFDTRALGYKSSLVAMRVAPERVNEAAEVLNQHPGVSHNYKRNHAYNIWFTIAVPPTSSIERTVEIMHELAGAEATRLLPTLRLFKIGVDLDMNGEREITAKVTPQYTEERRERSAAYQLAESDIALIREAQEDLPVEQEPFLPMAERLGTSEEAMFAHLARLGETGHYRRFAAILYHRNAGFRANPMAVWAVPEDRVVEVGSKMASFAAVSHCYQRPVYPDWPYNIFTMIHGQKVSDCEQVIKAISEETGIRDYALLYSTKEYKKTRVRYFVPELDEWEKHHLKVQARE